MLDLLFKKKSPSSARPNIVFILLDQFRNDCRDVHPVFEELQKRGTLFSQVITYAPYTSAAMRSMLTGMYGGANGVNAYTRYESYDNVNCYSLVEYLRDAGYYTRSYTYTKMLFPTNGLDQLNIVYEEDEKDVVASHKKELDACFARDQGKPFFLFLHYGEIHHAIIHNVVKKYGPFAEEFFGNVDKNREMYRRLAHGAGDYVRDMLRHIDSHDPNQETVVMIFADHGGSVGERPGEKCYGVYAYDYTICVWFYLLHKQRFAGGREFKNQVRQIDVLPTFLDVLGIKPSKKHKPILGESVVPIIEGRETADRIAFTETGGCEGPHPSPDSPNVKCVRDGRWKLIYNLATNKHELYDLREDPRETTNRYAERPDVAKRLWNKLVEHL